MMRHTGSINQPIEINNDVCSIAHVILSKMFRVRCLAARSIVQPMQSSIHASTSTEICRFFSRTKNERHSQITGKCRAKAWKNNSAFMSAVQRSKGSEASSRLFSTAKSNLAVQKMSPSGSQTRAPTGHNGNGRQDQEVTFRVNNPQFQLPIQKLDYEMKYYAMLGVIERMDTEQWPPAKRDSAINIVLADLLQTTGA